MKKFVCSGYNNNAFKVQDIVFNIYIIDYFDHRNLNKNALSVIVGGAIFSACIIYPARCIRRLYLLKDGSSIGIVTYGFWRSTKKFTVPLDDMSARTGLTGSGIFHKINIRNRWISYLVNKKDGKFYDKSTYETVIALKRF